MAAGRRARIDQRPSLLGAIIGLEEIARGDLAAPAGRAEIEAPFGRVLLGGEPFRMIEDVGDRLDLGMGFENIVGNEEAFDAAVRQDFGAHRDRAFLGRLVDLLAELIDPHLRRHVRLLLLGHRREGRHRVARHELGRAVIALFEDDLVDGGHDLGRGPVHVGDGDVAAVLRMGARCETEQPCGKNSRCEKASHDRSLFDRFTEVVSSGRSVSTVDDQVRLLCHIDAPP